MKRKILWLLLIIIISIQFIPVSLNQSDSFSKDDFIVVTKAPLNIASILKNSCYDCHSNHTKYLWYDKIAPISWWVAGHINQAKEELNFEEWAAYSLKKKKHKLEEIVEKTQEGHMPLKSYLWMHGDSKLSEIQLKELKSFINAIE